MTNNANITIVNNQTNTKDNNNLSNLNAYKDIKWVEISKRGTRGKANEDSVLAKPPFFGIADGVGGGSFGEVASETCLTHCAKNLSFNDNDIIHTIKTADKVIAQKIANLSDKLGASTLAAVWIKDNIVKAIHVGDARILYFRKNNKHWELAWISVDQTFENLPNNLEIPQHVNLEDPYAMLGTGAVGELIIKKFQLRKDDVILLCSDGLHKFISQDSINYTISSKLNNNIALDTIANQLLEQAIKNGSYDDISLLMLQYTKKTSSFNINFLAKFVLGALFIFILIISFMFMQNTIDDKSNNLVQNQTIPNESTLSNEYKYVSYQSPIVTINYKTQYFKHSDDFEDLILRLNKFYILEYSISKIM